jgi:hypothetical protein
MDVLRAGAYRHVLPTARPVAAEARVRSQRSCSTWWLPTSSGRHARHAHALRCIVCDLLNVRAQIGTFVIVNIVRFIDRSVTLGRPDFDRGLLGAARSPRARVRTHQRSTCIAQILRCRCWAGTASTSCSSLVRPAAAAAAAAASVPARTAEPSRSSPQPHWTRHGTAQWHACVLQSLVRLQRVGAWWWCRWGAERALPARAQDVLANFASGVQIILMKPYKCAPRRHCRVGAERP